jgi:hypothetical protein
MRRDWTHPTHIRAETHYRYIEAVQTLKRSGAYDNFVLIHQNAVNDPFAHGPPRCAYKHNID